MVIELKILHKSLEATIVKGLGQTAEDMDRCDLAEGHLVIFDRRPNWKWTDKMFRMETAHEGKAITIWGM